MQKCEIQRQLKSILISKFRVNTITLWNDNSAKAKLYPLFSPPDEIQPIIVVQRDYTTVINVIELNSYVFYSYSSWLITLFFDSIVLDFRKYHPKVY